MRRKYYSHVWFADEKRIRSITKTLAFSDKGSLRIEENFLEFKGKKVRVRVAKIRRISIARQQLPWISLLIVNILMGVCLTVLGMQLPLGFFPTTTSLLAYIIFALFVSDAFAIIVGYSMKWIKVEYGAEQNPPRFAYLADGSIFGWSGLFGGTEKLYKKINSSGI